MQKRFSMWVSVAAIATVCLWGAAFPMIQMGLRAYSPLDLVILRFMIASLTFSLFLFKVRVRLLKIKDLPVFIGLGVVGLLGSQLLLSYGVRLSGAASSAFVMGLSPMIVMFISNFFLKEKIVFRQYFGALLALLGIWVLLQAKAPQGILLNQGTLFLILAAFSFSLFLILQKVALLRGYSAFEVNCYTVWLPTLLLLFMGNPIELMSAFAERDLLASLSVWFIGIFSTSVAYMLWAYALQRMPVSRVSMYFYSVPFIAALLSYALLGERLSSGFLMGGILMAIGFLLANGAIDRKLT